MFWCGRRGAGGVGSTVCGASAGAGRVVLVRWWWCRKRGGGGAGRVTVIPEAECSKVSVVVYGVFYM